MMTMTIDPAAQISKYFQWREALFLKLWDRIATEKDGLNDTILNSLKNSAYKMDLVRNYFGRPIHVHCWYRPQAYNKLPQINGASDSQHVLGLAVDFHVEGMECDDVREKIEENGMLEHWGMCMENRPLSSWVHLDCREKIPMGGRFFWP